MIKWADRFLLLLLICSAGTVFYALHIRSTARAELTTTPCPPGFQRPAAADCILPPTEYNQALTTALADLASQAKANLVIRWPRFETINIAHPDTPIHTNLGPAKLLDRIATLFNTAYETTSGHPLTKGFPPPSVCTWDAAGTIYIDTPYNAYRPDCITRLYGVEDLINMLDAKAATEISDKPLRRGTVLDILQQFIEVNADPTTWEDRGGTFGAAQIWNEVFVIRQTVHAHGRIDRVLTYLRSPTGHKLLEHIDDPSNEVDSHGNPKDRYLIEGLQ